MKKLLCIVGGMNTGGAETFLMKVFRSLDRSKYIMDFCVAITERGFYDDEIELLGGVIHHVPPKSRNPFSSFGAIKRIVKDGKYDSVLRISQNSMSSIDLLAAKCGGAQNLLFRSSNTGTCGNAIEDIAHIICKPLVFAIPTVKIAPSSEAAVFMFGKRMLKNGKVEILKNGLDTASFKFDECIREKIRQENGWENKTVIGHVGRFNKQKNHQFLMDLISNEAINKEKTKLVLVGTGELKKTIEEIVTSNNLSDCVEFLGVRSDVNKLLMAFDVFVLPSLYEGMPNVAIEAQATGLPCILSDTITKEANITDLVKYLSIDNVLEWIDEIQYVSAESINRKLYADELVNNGYSIHDVITHFIRLAFPDGRNANEN